MERRGYIIPLEYEYDRLKNMTPNKFIQFFHRKVNEHNIRHPEDVKTILEYLSRDFGYANSDINNCKKIRVVFPGTPDTVKTTAKTQIDLIVTNLGLTFDSETHSIKKAIIVSDLPLSTKISEVILHDLDIIICYVPASILNKPENKIQVHQLMFDFLFLLYIRY